MHIQKLQHSAFSIRSYDKDSVLINETRYTNSILIAPDGISTWDFGSLANLSDDAFAKLTYHSPELILIGQKNLDLSLYPTLAARLSTLRIGCEMMQFEAACRTFNLLQAEGRKLHFLLLF